MLQRIQTLFLLVSCLLSGLIVFLTTFWINNKGTVYYLLDLLYEYDWKLKSLPIAFVLSAILSLLTIFLYKNRKQQITFNRFNIVVNFYLLGIIVYHLLIVSGESQISEKGIGLFIPVLVIVLLVLANKAILKDEKLVKSVDRLR
ncbi:MAG: DUF4293 domain-containing protein [Bacteroidetes bacterium]|nr:MAG: DUF4293 domain-containing protein [Bacteroidota bacterium]